MPQGTKTLPSSLQERVERHGRRSGIPLHELELIAQDVKVARDFLRAAREGRTRRFLETLDLQALERRLAERERGIPHVRAPCLVRLG